MERPWGVWVVGRGSQSAVERFARVAKERGGPGVRGGVGGGRGVWGEGVEGVERGQGANNAHLLYY